MIRVIATGTFLVVMALVSSPANAQSEVLAEMYGRGVHAYYAGDHDTAHRYLTMAIDNKTKDARAYYFRGLVLHATGRPDEAESDWKTGAEMEALGGANPGISRSLARFQGEARLKLETIRQEARLQALATAAARSAARYSEIQASEARVLRQPLRPISPPVPANQDDNPFSNDDTATGDATLQADDALENAMKNPFAADTSIPVDQVPPNDAVNPFNAGGGAGTGGGSPFGGAGAGDDDNPFGGAGAGAGTGGADDNPFGGAGAGAGTGGADDNPFGAGTGGGNDNPFGGSDDNPFGN